MTSTLFPQGAFQEEQADRAWTQQDTDRMFDMFLEGASPKQIAYTLRRTPKSIKVRVMKFARNEANMAEEYQPGHRLPRKGRRWNENEGRLLKPLRARGVPDVVIGRLLARDPETLPGAKPERNSPPVERGPRRKSGRKRPTVVPVASLGIEVDLVLAYRFLYYCKPNCVVVTDQQYDRFEREALDGASDEERRVLERVGSDNPDDYPNHVRALASYLVFKYRGGGELEV